VSGNHTQARRPTSAQTTIALAALRLERSALQSPARPSTELAGDAVNRKVFDPPTPMDSALAFFAPFSGLRWRHPLAAR